MATMQLNTLGLALDFGIIKVIPRYRPVVTTIGLALDYGVKQPKNFYPAKITTIGLLMDAGVAGFDYQIIT